MLEEMPVKNKGEDTEEYWGCLQNTTQVWQVWKEREEKEDWERRIMDYRAVLKMIWIVRCKIVELKSPIRIAQCMLQWTCAGPCTVHGTGAGQRKPGLSRSTSVDPEDEWSQRRLSVNYTPCSRSEQHTPMAATLVILNITSLWLFN